MYFSVYPCMIIAWFTISIIPSILLSIHVWLSPCSRYCSFLPFFCLSILDNHLIWYRSFLPSLLHHKYHKAYSKIKYRMCHMNIGGAKVQKMISEFISEWNDLYKVLMIIIWIYMMITISVRCNLKVKTPNLSQMGSHLASIR